MSIQTPQANIFRIAKQTFTGVQRQVAQLADDASAAIDKTRDDNQTIGIRIMDSAPRGLPQALANESASALAHRAAVSALLAVTPDATVKGILNASAGQAVLGVFVDVGDVGIKTFDAVASILTSAGKGAATLLDTAPNTGHGLLILGGAL